MSFEQKVNYQLNKIPKVKKVIKRVYQGMMYTISPKIKSEGKITRISPDDVSHEFFFGYYDKSPWDISDRYMLCMRADNTWSDVSPREKADILLIDTALPEGNRERVRKIAETHSWNVQQACMLQWLGPDFSSRILFNDYRNGQYVAIIFEISTGREHVVSAPVYTVSTDGKVALTLDFSRLYNLRPGYGYYNIPEKTKGIALPDAPAIWKIDMETGKVDALLTYRDFAEFQPRPEMQETDSVHKVNHLMISPNGKRCMVLYRWFVGQRKYTRLITFDVADGKNMYVLSDDDMVSHCFWKDNEHILAFENKKNSGTGYYLMRDKTQEYRRCWRELTGDGHPSYNSDKSYIVTDSYPNRARIQYLKVMEGENSEPQTLVKVFSPFKYDNDTRCDLHPRWNHTGDKICFDSVYEGHRGLYVADIFDVNGLTASNKQDDIKKITADHEERPLISVIVPVYNVNKYLRRCVNSIKTQSYTKTEIILVDDGSTDGSDELCDRLQRSDSRIKVIHKENGGLSSARNAGLEVARGSYIAFVDSDDWIASDIYDKCVQIIKRYKCEVVDFCVEFVKNETSVKRRRAFSDICVEGEEILYDYLYRGQTEKCPFSVCRKLYKKELFNELKFPEGKINEDIAINFKILQKCKRMVRISDVGYYYFQGNDNSITSGVLRKKDFDLLEAGRELCRLSSGCKNPEINKLAQIKLYRSYFSLLAKAVTGGAADDVNKKDMEFLAKNLRKNFNILMKSPMPKNRKLMIIALCINYKIIKIPFDIRRKIRGNKSNE